MNSDTPGVISSGNLDFTLHDDGDLTLRFRPGEWPSKLTDEDATKLSLVLETTLRNAIRRSREGGKSSTCLPPMFELKIPMESPYLNCLSSAFAEFFHRGN